MLDWTTTTSSTTVTATAVSGAKSRTATPCTSTHSSPSRLLFSTPCCATPTTADTSSAAVSTHTGTAGTSPSTDRSRSLFYKHSSLPPVQTLSTSHVNNNITNNKASASPPQYNKLNSSNNRNNTTSSTATVPVSAVKCHINEMNIKNTADIDMSTSSSYVPITEAVVLTRGGTGAIEMDYFNDELIEINPIFFDPFLFTNNNSTHSQKHSVSSPAADTHKYK